MCKEAGIVRISEQVIFHSKHSIPVTGDCSLEVDNLKGGALASLAAAPGCC